MEIKNVTNAGPIIIPQNPIVESPAIIEKKISNSFTAVGVFTTLLLMYLIIIGLIKVSAIMEMTIIE
jgi:uncharacterized membrane protein